MIENTKMLGFLLIDGFALMSYASVVEPFRAANQLSGRQLYRWVHVSPDGRPGVASNGAMIVADQGVDHALECDALFVFAGGDPATFVDQPTFAWLRRIARTSAVMAGVSAGPYLMAKAGLLDGYRATIHWEHRVAFSEAFPDVVVEPGLYAIDRRRVTCAGGMGGMDLAIELIERERGQALAAQVSDWFIRGEPRSANRPQRLSLRDRYGVTNDHVLKALAFMEAAVEDPVPRSMLARTAGVSIRQLERLFLRCLGQTMNTIYLAIRLDQAAQLLRATGMNATDVGIACGFKSVAHFSRTYKTRFGRSPTHERR